MNSPRTLSQLFSPRSIAVIGASSVDGKIGAMPITLLKKHGYSGKIYPVNPKSEEIQGLRCYPSLASIPDEIDLAIVSVPAKYACEALQNARPSQVVSAVIFSSGFAEIDEVGRLEQQRLQALAAARNIRLLGPNCLGFMNLREDVYATFTPAVLNGIVRPGNIGMVTQSGAFGAYAYSLMAQRGLGLSYWITTGNESDIDVADCIELLAADPHTDVIMAYMEGCKDGDKLKRAFATAAQANKRVVITKIGRTQAGAQAAASHTAAMAGDDAVYNALFHQYGVLRAHSIDEFFNIGHALSVWSSEPSSAGLGIMSISGGVGALMADDAEDMGLDLPSLTDEAQQRLLQRIPFAGTQNPVDITGQALADPEILLDTANDMLASGQFGALVVFLAAAGGSEALWLHIQRFAKSLHEQHPDIPLAISALLPPERQAILEQYGCITFSDPSAAIRTAGALLKRNSNVPKEGVSADTPNTGLPPLNGALNEAESLSLLQAAGVPVVDFEVANSEAEAAAIMEHFDRPVAMKIVSRDILHKSDVGGIKLNVAGAQEALGAYREILGNVATRAATAVVDGVLMAPMMSGGVECIVGVHRDPVFGPVVMFGLGGVFVEVLKDTSFRLAPFDEKEALSMIRETRAYTVLKGIRGKRPADLEELARVLAAISRLAYAHRDRLASIDINPLVVFEDSGLMALDSVVLLGADGN